MNGRTSRGDIRSGDILNATELRKALRGLQVQNARPVEGNYYALLVHPNTMYDLQSDTVISNALANAANRGDDNALFTGEVGRFAGFVFVMSTNAQFYSGSGYSTATGISDVYASLAVGRNAYGITTLDQNTVETIYHEPGSGGSTGDQLNQVASLGWKINFAPVILNQSWLRRIEHTVSA